MKKIFLSCMVFALFFNGHVGITGKIFPALSGTTLSGKSVAIPGDTKGKLTVIGLAYSENAERALSTWLPHAYNKFIAKNGLFDSVYDAHVYFIPMIVGLNQVAAEAAEKRIRQQTDKAYHPYVILYKGEIRKFKDEVAMTDKDLPYFFVLDKEGKIVYNTSGVYTDEKMSAIEEELAE